MLSIGAPDPDGKSYYAQSNKLPGDVFLLPNTGPDGAAVMARRVGEIAGVRGLRDLVGDPIVISCGLSTCPHPEVAAPGRGSRTVRTSPITSTRKG